MKYASAAAFRSALSAHLRGQAGAGEDLQRLQRRLAYERFLARLFRVVGDTWVLKGGYALELRLGGRARATRDVDFSAPPGTDLLDQLQEAAELDLRDFFRFVVQLQQAHLGGPPEGGQRFQVRAYLDGSAPFSTFLLDVGQGDVLLGPAERLPARIDLTFAGLTPEVFPTYPLPEHFAEKVHAYTRPRLEGGRTRVKDLLDLSLIVTDLGLTPSAHLAEVISAVFARYGSHELPRPLPAPPVEWDAPFREGAATLGHTPVSTEEALADVQRLIDESFLLRQERGG